MCLGFKDAVILYNRNTYSINKCKKVNGIKSAIEKNVDSFYGMVIVVTNFRYSICRRSGP